MSKWTWIMLAAAALAAYFLLVKDSDSDPLNVVRGTSQKPLMHSGGDDATTLIDSSALSGGDYTFYNSVDSEGFPSV